MELEEDRLLTIREMEKEIGKDIKEEALLLNFLFISMTSPSLLETFFS